MSRKKTLFKNSLLFALGNMGVKLISFIMVPLYTNVLSLKEYGAIDIMLTVSMLLSPLLMGNIQESVMRFLLDKNADRNKIVSTAVITFFIGLIISFALLPTLGFFELTREYRWIMYIYVVVSAASPIPLTYIRGTEKIRLYALLNILSAFLTAAFNILFLIYFKMGINGYLLSIIASSTIVSILGIILSKMYIHLRKLTFDKAIFFPMLKYSLLLVPNSLLWWITNSSDRIMITSFLGVNENALYAVAYKLPTIISLLASILMQAWQITAIKESDATDINEFSNATFNLLFKFLFICGSGLLLLLKPFMNFYVSDAYFVSWEYTPVLILAAILGALGSFVGTSYTVAKNSKGMLMSALAGAIINLVLNVALIPIMGVNGASIATCISYFVVLIYRSIATKKYVSIDIAKPSYISIFVVFIIQIVCAYLDEPFNNIFMSTCFVIIIIFSINEIMESMNLIVGNIKKVCKNLKIYRSN